jgi:DNA-binding beta-propeller fold protein YncE
VLRDLPALGDTALEPLAGTGLAVDPLRVAVASDGTSYVLDVASRGVFHRRPGSREEHVLQDKAGQPAVFQAPSDMALGPDERLYVLDAANSIAIFGADRRIERTLDLGPLGVFSPRGLAVAPDGTIAVADAGNSRILLLDGAGRLLKQIGRGGRGEGELAVPMGVAFDGAGGVVVVDAGNARLQRFAADGAFVASWPRPGTPADVWAPRVSTDSAGDVWVAGGENEEIWRLPREARGAIQVFPGPTGVRIAGLDAAGPGVLHLLVRKSGQVLTLRALSDPASGPTVRRER